MNRQYLLSDKLQVAYTKLSNGDNIEEDLFHLIYSIVKRAPAVYITNYINAIHENEYEIELFDEFFHYIQANACLGNVRLVRNWETYYQAIVHVLLNDIISDNIVTDAVVIIDWKSYPMRIIPII